MLEHHRREAEALQMCLTYLGREAQQMNLPFVHLLIGMAVEELDRLLEAERRRH
ncbi:MAG: hypothetical protein IRY94_15695 [Rhodospirillaceae bacterium]|nr:hypothetical protein [Rhodospirillaceae bacterium]